MNKKAMYKFSYGLFVLTTSYEGKDNGCTINTAIQVASDPNLISIAFSQENYTHDMIMGAKRFNISVISQDVSLTYLNDSDFSPEEMSTSLRDLRNAFVPKTESII